MLITAWILLVFFGMFSVVSTFQFFLSSLGRFHAILWFIAIIITAVAAGIIWGGLFQSPEAFNPANFDIPMIKKP
jgi:hypothetical protein